MIRRFFSYTTLIGLLLAGPVSSVFSAPPAKPAAPAVKPPVVKTAPKPGAPKELPRILPKKKIPMKGAIEVDGGLWLVVYHCKYRQAHSLKKMMDDVKDAWNKGGLVKVFHDNSDNVTMVSANAAGAMVQLPNYNRRMALIFLGPFAGLQMASKLIQEFDTPVLQVKIDVKIVEVTYTSNLQVGFEILFDYFQATGGSALKAARSSFFPATFAGSLPTTATATPGMGTFLLNRTTTSYKLDAAVAALKSNGRAEILSEPSVIVAAGVPATFRAVQSVPIVESSIAGTLGNVSVKTTFKEIGITMRVIPLMVSEDTVYLDINPSVQEITGSQDTTSGGVTVSNPLFVTRELRTQMTVGDDRTVVMGGLHSKKTILSEKKLPLLGDIPLLGVLFTSSSREKTKTEVIFFIHVKIENPKNATGIGLPIAGRRSKGLPKGLPKSLPLPGKK